MAVDLGIRGDYILYTDDVGNEIVAGGRSASPSSKSLPQNAIALHDTDESRIVFTRGDGTTVYIDSVNQTTSNVPSGLPDGAFGLVGSDPPRPFAHRAGDSDGFAQIFNADYNVIYNASVSLNSTGQNVIDIAVDLPKFQTVLDTGVTIEYKKSVDNTYTEYLNWSNNQPGDTISQEITGLDSGTDYDIRVRHAGIKAGDTSESYGDWAYLTQVSTDSAAISFNGPISTSASACTSGFCETTFDSTSETKNVPSGWDYQGDWEVSVDVGGITSNADASVTVEFKDSSGNVDVSRTVNYDSTNDSQTDTFTMTPSTTTTQITVISDVSANSQNTSGGFGCSGSGDCSYEFSSLDSAVTIKDL